MSILGEKNNPSSLRFKFFLAVLLVLSSSKFIHAPRCIAFFFEYIRYAAQKYTFYVLKKIFFFLFFCLFSLLFLGYHIQSAHAQQGIQGLNAINQKAPLPAKNQSAIQNSTQNSNQGVPQGSTSSENNNNDMMGDMSPSPLGQMAFNEFKAPNLLSQIDSQNQILFTEKINLFLEKAEKITLFIFYALVLCAILSNAFIHLIKGVALKSFLIDFFLILLFANFWQMMIMNWQGIHQNILDFLSNQGFQIQSQSYQDWLLLLFNYTQKVLRLVDHNLNQTLVLLAFFLPILYLWVRWLVLYISTVIQAVVVAQLMVILFAFAPISPHYARKPITYTLASFIKIILLQIMALAFAELVDFYLTQALDMAQLLIIFIIIYLMLHLATHLEKLLDQIFQQDPFYGQIKGLQQDLERQIQSVLYFKTGAQANTKGVDLGANKANNLGSTNAQNNGMPITNHSYQMKKEREPIRQNNLNNLNNRNAGNTENKSQPRFDGNFDGKNIYQNNALNPSMKADHMHQLQRQVWQVKVQQKNTAQGNSENMKNIKGKENKSFTIKK